MRTVLRLLKALSLQEQKIEKMSRHLGNSAWTTHATKARGTCCKVWVWLILSPPTQLLPCTHALSVLFHVTDYLWKYGTLCNENPAQYQKKKMNYRNNRVSLACCGWKVIPYQYRGPITTLTCHLDYTLFNPRRKFPLKQEITPYLDGLKKWLEQ